MAKLVSMLIVCWVPQNGTLVEAWRIEDRVALDHCLTMNKLFTGAGRHAAITVRCD